MSKTQLDLLTKLIEAERYFFRRCVEAARKDKYVSHDHRLVEVGKINGVGRRTAMSLVAMGLAETAAKVEGDVNRLYSRSNSTEIYPI
jgi:adenine-specific DNA glycosylase